MVERDKENEANVEKEVKEENKKCNENQKKVEKKEFEKDDKSLLDKLKKENQELKNNLKELEKERDDYKQRLYNLKERFDDYKEMIEKEKMLLMYNTKKKILEQFLVPFEKLKLSLNYKDEPEFVSAIEMVYKDMVKVFDFLKMKFITPKKGDPFDPFEHEVIDKFETKEVKEYTIYDVQSIGYKIEGEVIKPAKVIVAVKPKEKNKEELEQNNSCKEDGMNKNEESKNAENAEGIDSKEGGN